MADRAQEVQEKINKLQEEMHKEVALSDAEFNKKRDDLFSERHTKIAEMIAEKKMPANFWALALISAMQKVDKENDTAPHFLGPYDETLLSTYLKDLRVVFTETGFKVTLTFAENPFFEETELWAECIESPVDDHDEEDEEDEEDGGEEAWEFSGITWKAGHGPADDDDEEEEDEEDAEAPGHKRQRDGKPAAGDNAHSGPSLLEVFSVMPPPPGDESGADEMDEDELADAEDMWQEEMEDRHTLMDLIVGMIFFNPWEAIKKEDDSNAKKAKTE